MKICRERLSTKSGLQRVKLVGALSLVNHSKRGGLSSCCCLIKGFTVQFVHASIYESTHFLSFFFFFFSMQLTVSLWSILQTESESEGSIVLKELSGKGIPPQVITLLQVHVKRKCHCSIIQGNNYTS